MWGLFVLVLIWEACSLTFFVSKFYLSFSKCFCLGFRWLDSRLYPWPKTGQILHSRSCLCVLFWLPTAGRCEPKGWGEVAFPRQGTGGWTSSSVEQSEAEVRWGGNGTGLGGRRTTRQPPASSPGCHFIHLTTQSLSTNTCFCPYDCKNECKHLEDKKLVLLIPGPQCLDGCLAWSGYSVNPDSINASRSLVHNQIGNRRTCVPSFQRSCCFVLLLIQLAK